MTLAIQYFEKVIRGRGVEGNPSTFLSDDDVNYSACSIWSDGTNLRLTQWTSGGDGDNITCWGIHWKAGDRNREIFEDCFDLCTSHWYGGSVIKVMKWPIERISECSRPYIVADALKAVGGFGSVQERYWVKSNGLAIYVD